MPPKPGALTAIQVILFVRVALGVLGLFATLVGWGVTNGSEVWNTVWTATVVEVEPESYSEEYAGLYFGIYLSSFVVTGALIAFDAYVAATLGRGGLRRRDLVRAVVVIGFLGTVLRLLSGQGFELLLILMIVVVTLNESASAEDWYRETEYPTPRRGTV